MWLTTLEDYNLLWFPFSFQRNTQLEPNFISSSCVPFLKKALPTPSPQLHKLRAPLKPGFTPGFPLVSHFPRHVLCARPHPLESRLLVVLSLRWISFVPAADLLLLPSTLLPWHLKELSVHFSGQLSSRSLTAQSAIQYPFFLPRLWHITCLIFVTLANIGPSLPSWTEAPRLRPLCSLLCCQSLREGLDLTVRHSVGIG